MCLSMAEILRLDWGQMMFPHALGKMSVFPAIILFTWAKIISGALLEQAVPVAPAPKFSLIQARSMAKPISQAVILTQRAVILKFGMQASSWNLINPKTAFLHHSR